MYSSAAFTFILLMLGLLLLSFSKIRRWRNISEAYKCIIWIINTGAQKSWVSRSTNRACRLKLIQHWVAHCKTHSLYWEHYFAQAGFLKDSLCICMENDNNQTKKNYNNNTTTTTTTNLIILKVQFTQPR